MLDDFLKCDADGCDHVENVGKITEEMIDMQCRACGSNLLTRPDWEQWTTLNAFLAAVNKVVPKDEDGPKMKTSLHVHQGKVTFTAEPADVENSGNEK